MRHFPRILLFAFFAPAVVVGESPWCQNKSAPAKPNMYGDMGAYVDLVDNKDLPSDPVVAALFKQGLGQLYGFNLVESNRNFRTAAQLDPNCVLCHWGVATAHSPSINYYIMDQNSLNLAAQKAMELMKQQSSHLSEKTKRLVYASSKLIAPANYTDSPQSPYRKAWSDSLCEDSDDSDIKTFCAGSLMALTPWNYYQGVPSGGRYDLKTMLVPAKKKLLESVEVHGRPHVLAIHLLIHLLEPSNAPLSFRWEALHAATLLFNGSKSQGELVPSQGHLTHMPAHLFLRTGLYNEGVDTSTVSTSVNTMYDSKCLVAYCHGHNQNMYLAHARMAGRLKDGMNIATHILNQKTAGDEPVLGMKGQFCCDCGGPGSAGGVMTLMRFGKWDEILKMKVPSASAFDPVDKNWANQQRAMWHYTRAAAYWAMSHGGEKPNMVQLGDAEALLSRAAAKKCADPGNLVNLTAIIPAELDGLRSYHVDRDWHKAIQSYRDAVAFDDSNPYMEPPAMYYPPRHCLGALLASAPEAEGGNATEALETFERDLTAFVENAWSLYGAAAAAEKMGKVEEAKQYKTRAGSAWRRADEPFVSPCPQLFSQD